MWEQSPYEILVQESGLIQVGAFGRGAFEFAGNQRTVIESATWDGKKKLTLAGSAFGEASRVPINGCRQVRKDHINLDSSKTVKGKAKKLGLAPGDNTN